jgi:hypothetical protein
MILHPSKKMSKIISNHFESMLLHGAFPEVHYEKYEGGHSYYMFEYSNTHARLAKLVDILIKEKLHEPLGIFTRKQNAAFMVQVIEMVTQIKEADVALNPERFHSFADDVMAEAMK